MNWFRRIRCKITLQFMVFIFQYHINRTYVILRQTDSCVSTHRQRNQFSEFHSDSSVEEYEFHPKEENLTFELSFCTLSRIAILAKLQNMALGKTLFTQIVNGSIILSVEEFQNWQPECYWNVQGKSVSDGTHHTIKISISPGLLDAQLYHMSRPLGGEKSINFSHCVTNGTLGEPRHIEIGGEIVERYNDSKVQVLYGFTGCMSNIRLNGQPIEQEAEQDTSIDGDVTDGCMEFQESCTDICPPTFEFKDGYCECPEGNHVDKTGACSPSCECTECQNGGTCILSAPGPKCVCPEGYSGSFCEDSLNPCTCYNGSCERIAGSVSFWCKCHRGYTGTFCNETDVCFQNPCSNGGACIRNSTNHADFTCNCLSGYFGRLCAKEESKSSGVALSDKVLIIALGCAFIVLIIVYVTIKVLKRHCAKSINKTDQPSDTPVNQRELSSLDEQPFDKTSLNNNSEQDNSTSGQDNSISGQDNSISGQDNSTSGQDNSTSGQGRRASEQSRNTSEQDNNTNNAISEISHEKERESQDNDSFPDSGNVSGGDSSSICSREEPGESFHRDSDDKSIKSGMITKYERNESSFSLDNDAEDVVSAASSGSCEKRLLENPSDLMDDAISISSDMRSASEENEDDLENSEKLVNDCTDVANDCADVVNDSRELMNDIPELMNDIPELMNDIPELMNDIPELVNDRTEVVDDITEVVNDITEVVNDSTELVNDIPELVNDINDVLPEEEPEVNEITHLQIENHNTDEDSNQSQETYV